MEPFIFKLQNEVVREEGFLPFSHLKLVMKVKHLLDDSLKASQHTLPTTILDFLTTTVNIFHSYFSSLVTCSTQITNFYSPFPIDKIFGSLGNAFQYNWKGMDWLRTPT